MCITRINVHYLYQCALLACCLLSISNNKMYRFMLVHVCFKLYSNIVFYKNKIKVLYIFVIQIFSGIMTKKKLFLWLCYLLL